MRPASRTNLSFHSSSDYSVRPIYLDEHMSALSSNVADIGMENSAASPFHSDAFATARSAGGFTPGEHRATPPATPRRLASSPPAAKGAGSIPSTAAAPCEVSGAPPAAASRLALSGHIAEGVDTGVGGAPVPGLRRSPLIAPEPPLSRRPSDMSAHQPASAELTSPQSAFAAPPTAGERPPLGEHPTESPSPRPPPVLSRRARRSARVAGRGGPAETASTRDVEEPAPARSAGVGSWWGSALRALRTRSDHVREVLDSLIDPGPRGVAARPAPLAAATTTPTSTRGGAGASPTASSGFDGLFDDVGHSPTREVRGFGGPGGGSEGGRRPPRAHLRGYGGDLGVRTERVRVNPDHVPFGLLPPMAQPIAEITEEEQLLDDAVDVDEEPPMIEVDLVSALHGYCDNPNEAYGHLVAAALSTRSKSRPVTGEEIAEARHNAYLVRLIVNSDCLDCDDPLAQRNVQETLDSLFPDERAEVTPALFEYLETFFRMPFVKLSHERYTLLKSSGFENIGLMYRYPHVLPDEKLHSIILSYSDPMWAASLLFMLLSLAASVCCTASTALVLADWMIVHGSSYQDYGFYTLIAYGCGYALHLIFMVFLMRTKENEQLYEDTGGLTVPSAYSNVCPVLPIFEVFCLVTFIRARRKPRLIAFTHNVVVASRLAACCYALCFGFPQYIVQSYFHHTSSVVDPRYVRRWPFYMLMVTALVQWAIALLRFGWMMSTYDSVSGLGFACFNIRRIHHSIERHSAIPKIMIYLMVYVLECGVYIIVAASIEFDRIDGCLYLPTSVISVAGVTVLTILVLYFMLVFKEDSLVRISFISILVCLLVVATLVLGSVHSGTACEVFVQVIFHKSFVFGYIAYAAYLSSFVLWLVMLVLVLLAELLGISVFPRLKRPLVRPARTRRLSSESDDSVAKVEAAQQDAGDGGASDAGKRQE